MVKRCVNILFLSRYTLFCIVILISFSGYDLYAQTSDFKCGSIPSNAKVVLKKKLGRKYDYLIRVKQEFDIDAEYLSDREFNDLNPYELFVYCLMFPESFNQNCSGEGEIDDEEYWDGKDGVKESSPYEKVYGYITTDDDFTLSERQINKLKKNKKAIIDYVKQNTKGRSYLPCNYKDLIIQINAIETIPWLINYFENNSHRKDKEVLTVLCSLMYQNEFGPFMESKSCAKMYLRLKKPNYIEFNSANIKITLERAMDFYKSRY
jgi:hypothetical protein